MQINKFQYQTLMFTKNDPRTVKVVWSAIPKIVTASDQKNNSLIRYKKYKHITLNFKITKQVELQEKYQTNV